MKIWFLFLLKSLLIKIYFYKKPNISTTFQSLILMKTLYTKLFKSTKLTICRRFDSSSYFINVIYIFRINLLTTNKNKTSPSITRTTGPRVHRIKPQGLYNIRFYFSPIFSYKNTKNKNIKQSNSVSLIFFNHENHGTQGPPEKDLKGL